MRSRLLFGLAFLFVCFWLGSFDQSLANASLWQPSNMPIVFVDPPTITASVGENFTISVKIFNLSNNFHVTDEQWEYGEPLGPPGLRFNYSLGNLYGLELFMSWDPTLLEYVNHTRKMPIEDYPDGILHEPIGWADEVNQSLGTYWLHALNVRNAPAFNAPNENATMFCMTFRGKEEGICIFNITGLDLVIPILRPEFLDVYPAIPYWMFNGQVDVIPELHLFMLPVFIMGTLAVILLKLKLRQT